MMNTMFMAMVGVAIRVMISIMMVIGHDNAAWKIILMAMIVVTAKRIVMIVLLIMLCFMSSQRWVNVLN